MKAIDISGQRFGRLLAVSPIESTSVGIVWKFICDCGNEYKKLAKAVRYNPDKKSCGCLQKEIWSERCKKMNYRHGMTDSRVWKSWVSMLDRCSNPNAPKFKHYGGRGIDVCNEWKVFENFYKDMGDRPEGMTLDRIDVNLGYNPQNCRWATHKEQRHNRRQLAVN